MDKEGENKEKGCNCEVQTPEMAFWGFIGFIVGTFVGFLFQNIWITLIAVIFFSSLFTELCRRRQKRRAVK